ncbi:hypothetical protein BDZ94DRAFT_82578 [Collybia nuda]|uniref:Uncharacterized protein n=1 Tax=Collybia nuda TaxID=64659 RepID=A0A9P6CDY1_9AGAR|nr:hypothetical protein BDZ94DRAFT_82578 [Collybia nuda]
MFLPMKGIISGESIAVGAALTLIIFIIIFTTRRIRRIRIEAELAAKELKEYLPVSPERIYRSNATGAGPGTGPFDRPKPIVVQNVEEGMSGPGESILQNIHHSQHIVRRGLSVVIPEIGLREEGGQRDRDERPFQQLPLLPSSIQVQQEHHNQNRGSNQAFNNPTSVEGPVLSQTFQTIISSSAFPEVSPTNIPEDGKEYSVYQLPPTLHDQSSISGKQRQEYRNAPIQSPPPSFSQNPQDRRTSTEAQRRYSVAPESEYAPSTYPVSTLPPYPDTARSVSPPPYYFDLSRVHTLQSAHSNRSAHDISHWSRGDISSTPTSSIQWSG